MQTNLSGLGKALGFSRQHANRLSREDGFPYLQKPGERGATRWLVDTSQVRRWLEEREIEKVEAAADREAWALEERLYREFWNQLLWRGYDPILISSIRDKCLNVEQLKKKAKELGFSLG